GVLTDIQFRSADDGVAVGYLAKDGTDDHHVFMLRWKGKGWKRMDLPWSDDFAALPRAVSLGGDGTIWIAGTKTANDSREPRGFIANGKGDTWRVSSLGTPNDIRSEVMAVAATNSGAVAAASVGASLLVLRACGENISSSSLSIASTKAGTTTKRQLSVSRIAARRASQKQDNDYVHEHHDPSTDIKVKEDVGGDAAFSIATDAQEVIALASSPIRHPAFYVKDMAKASGLSQWTKTYDGFAADFDGNGYKDVFYSRHGTIMPRLAMNDRGKFTNTNTSAFSSVDRHGCATGDIDGDGNKDILCAVGASRGKAMKRHELTIKPHKSGRQLVMGAFGISDPLGRGRQTGILRLNQDKYAEVFITNASDRDDGWPGYNRFYKNVNGTLVPAPEVGLDSSHGAECVETGDFDGDGDQDLAYCTQYGFAGREAGLRFMRNENGVLRDRTVGQEIRQIGDIDVAFADVTGDGKRDLIQLAPNKLRVSKWTSAGYRLIYQVKITYAWALAAGDASGDGRADIYVVRGNDKDNKPDRLLVSKNRGTRFASVKIPTTSKG
ncbi:MAG: FG-GAP repeat domain-containing protein, partial [Anaerolineae bacterium]